MSKLTNCQIHSMIDRLESTIRNAEPKGLSGTATRARKKLADYKTELQLRLQDEKGHTGRSAAQLDRPKSANDLCFQQKQLSKNVQLARFQEADMDQKKDELTIVGDQVEVDHKSALDVAMWVGRQQAFGMISNKCSAAQAAILKRMKDTLAHKAFGLTREEFCSQQLGINRSTADRIIANLEEFGTAYFTLSNIMRISPATYRLLAPAVDGNELVFGDDRIPITKANADRILEAVNAARDEAEQAKKQLSTTKSDLKKARDERDNAKKAAEKSRQDLIEFRRREQEAFPGATDRQNRLLRAQTQINFACQLIAGVNAEADLDDTERAWVEGLCAYGVKILIEITGHDPFIAAELKGRDLISEFLEQKSGKDFSDER